MIQEVGFLEKEQESVGKHKILIVEDMKVLADYMNELLLDFGYDVVGVCTKGEDVLEVYKKLQPDVIIVDITLEGEMTGIDVVNEVRSIANPTVIYSTSSMSDEVFEQAKKTKPDGFLKKPFDGEQLKATTGVAIHRFQERNKEMTALKDANSMQSMNIKELSETNAHLVVATWRERELKKQLKESLEELEASKRIIEQQNKRIVDSINYAKRIQQAIIPNSIEISADLPNHFMIYHPKDVVSGDFPWVFKKDDYVYFGVVDCTGHGVPGAMLSMIGYLLLDGIVSSSLTAPTPSIVLKELHTQIVKTLKQDVEGNNASDGMDIALCRINTVSSEVTYSGAHRPLYHLAAGGIKEYKGARFPIGGVQYKSEYLYEDVQFVAGDEEAIYFFSDGLPDQFGGEQNRKFGSKRIRNLILENKEKSMTEIGVLFDQQLTNWRGGQKQLDDILMVGVKF